MKFCFGQPTVMAQSLRPWPGIVDGIGNENDTARALNSPKMWPN